jgi:hypothetical protein
LHQGIVDTFGSGGARAALIFLFPFTLRTVRASATQSPLLFEKFVNKQRVTDDELVSISEACVAGQHAWNVGWLGEPLSRELLNLTAHRHQGMIDIRP